MFCNRYMGLAPNLSIYLIWGNWGSSTISRGRVEGSGGRGRRRQHWQITRAPGEKWVYFVLGKRSQDSTPTSFLSVFSFAESKICFELAIAVVAAYSTYLLTLFMARFSNVLCCYSHKGRDLVNFSIQQGWEWGLDWIEKSFFCSSSRY